MQRQEVAAKARRPSERRLRSFALRLALYPRVATSFARPLPEFLIIGAQKAGTSSLYANLCKHPSVCPSIKKEVHYFDFESGRRLAWYRAHFPTSLTRRERGGRRSISGEATPFLLFHPLAPERVAAALPDVKLVALLRDPVDRAISHYHHEVRHGHETRPIDLALAADAAPPEPEDPASYDDPGGALRHASYLARGRYAEQLERWYRHFDSNRLLVLPTEGIARSDAGFAQVLEFLGLRAWQPDAFTDRNVQHYPPTDPELRARLADYFAPHNQLLWRLLGAEWDWTRPD